jgi:hypothetical protein
MILGRRRDVAFHRMITQERDKFRFTHMLEEMTIAVEGDMSRGPLNIGIHGADPVMQPARREPDPRAWPLVIDGSNIRPLRRPSNLGHYS